MSVVQGHGPLNRAPLNAPAKPFSIHSCLLLAFEGFSSSPDDQSVHAIERKRDCRHLHCRTMLTADREPFASEHAAAPHGLLPVMKLTLPMTSIWLCQTSIRTRASQSSKRTSSQELTALLRTTPQFAIVDLTLVLTSPIQVEDLGIDHSSRIKLRLLVINRCHDCFEVRGDLVFLWREVTESTVAAYTMMMNG